LSELVQNPKQIGNMQLATVADLRASYNSQAFTYCLLSIAY